MSEFKKKKNTFSLESDSKGTEGIVVLTLRPRDEDRPDSPVNDDSCCNHKTGQGGGVGLGHNKS